MERKEEFLVLDKDNLSEHIEEIRTLFGAEKLQINHIGLGAIPFTAMPKGRTETGKYFDWYLVSEVIGPHMLYTKPRFFLRTHFTNAFILIIETISDEQLKKWEQQLEADKNYFTRTDSHETVFFEVSKNAYLRFSIKRQRFDNEQRAELGKIFDCFFSKVSVPDGQHDCNRHITEVLKKRMRELSTEKKDP